jgi:hypothetical protein
MNHCTSLKNIAWKVKFISSSKVVRDFLPKTRLSIPFGAQLVRTLRTVAIPTRHYLCWQKHSVLRERQWQRYLIVICGHPCKKDESAPVVAEVADYQCPNRSFG